MRGHAWPRGRGLEKQREGPPGNHRAIGLEPRLHRKLVARAVQLRQEVQGAPEVDDGGGGVLRPTGCCLRGGVRAGRGRPPVLDVPGVSRGCWQRGCLQAMWCDSATSMRLQEVIYVVENILEDRFASSRRGGGAHASRHAGERPGLRSATHQCPLPRRGRRGLSPITPCVPPGQLPRSRVGQEVVLCQSRGWHCRSFVIVAIMTPIV